MVLFPFTGPALYASGVLVSRVFLTSRENVIFLFASAFHVGNYIVKSFCRQDNAPYPFSLCSDSRFYFRFFLKFSLFCFIKCDLNLSSLITKLQPSKQEEYSD